MSRPNPEEVVRAYPLFRLVIGKTTNPLVAAARAFVVCSLLPAGLAAVTLWEGTWILSGTGRGLAEHYGYWAFFVTTPLIVFLSWAMLIYWQQLLEDLPTYALNGNLPQGVKDFVQQHTQSLALRARSRFILWLFVIIAVYLVALNIRRTINPMPVYGNDVFDAYAHQVSFFSGKLYLALLYCAVYPTAIFLSLHITLSMIFLLKMMCEQKLLRIDYFHPDNCGGVSRFGLVNLLIMLIYACLAAIIVSLNFTHHYQEQVNILPSFIVSALLIAQSFGAVYYIHRFVRTKRAEALDAINKELNRELMKVGRSGRFPDELLFVRNHVLSLKTYPYAQPVSVAVNSLRFAPAAYGVIRLFL